MNINEIYLPSTAQEYVEEQFKDRVTIKHTHHDTMMVIFNDNITREDVSDLFFAGAYWAIHLKK